MGALRSNWDAVVDTLAMGTRDPSLAAALDVRASGRISLAEAASMLGEPTDAPGWRRKLTRRLRYLERLHGVSLLVPQIGRRGTVVLLEGLRETCPVPVASVLALQELHARIVGVESRVASLEGEAEGPKSSARPKRGRK
ncbi:hypothetical protein [Polyangium sp. y55x31]|uniref:hypothetical protein n=1 Tax=Polyangium sp. y55x31 TaxID=3042688 RepID=UPI002482E04A|nr:hypothetical protein [Polyangium sp. y55x31]MDI1484804.1 hypothetical protein [Polyangium sp. y55x31]